MEGRYRHSCGCKFASQSRTGPIVETKQSFEPLAWRLFQLTAALGLACGCALLIGLAIFIARLDWGRPMPMHADGIVALTGGSERIAEAVDLLTQGFGGR